MGDMYRQKFRQLEIMNRGQTKELLPVMQAYADGKTIQHRAIDGGYWYDIEDDRDVDWDRYEYRVKPNNEYCHFESADECWNEMSKHKPFGWVGNKKSGTLLSINTVYESNAYFEICIGDNKYLFSEAFEKFRFVDGTPFGAEKQ